MNAFDNMRDAIATAKTVQNAARNNANTMAQMIVGELRHVGESTLVSLKNELRAYNIHTRRWRANK